MSFRSVRLWAGVVTVIGLGVAAPPGQAAYTTSFNKHVDGALSPSPGATATFRAGAEAQAFAAANSLTYTAGSVLVEVEVAAEYNADLYAFYFNILNNNSTIFNSLSIQQLIPNAPSTGTVFSKQLNSVDRVNGNNSTSVNPLGGFDVGVQFGRQGSSGGSIERVVFAVTAGATVLTTADFVAASTVQRGGQDVFFALRAQTTSGQFGSWKLYATAGDGINTPQGVTAPAPAGLVLLASAAPFALLLRRLRRQPAAA